MQQHQEAGCARKQIVHAVQLVRAMPFYGYHKEERIFMKVVLYNPGQVTRIATLLQVKLSCLPQFGILAPKLLKCMEHSKQGSQSRLYVMDIDQELK